MYPKFILLKSLGSWKLREFPLRIQYCLKNFPLSSIGAPEKEKASQLCADWLCPLRGCFMPQAN